MGNFAENLNLGNRVHPPPSGKTHPNVFLFFAEKCQAHS